MKKGYYIEQIHVFISAEVNAKSSLLSELGKVFSPFSSILFTESSSYRLPLFKDDGSIWDTNLLYPARPLTIIGLSQTPSLADHSTGFSQGGSGREGGTLEKGKERDVRDEDKADENDKNPSNKPEDPPGYLGGIPAGTANILFEIASEIHLIQDDQNAFKFQTLNLHGSLAIEVLFIIAT